MKSSAARCWPCSAGEDIQQYACAPTEDMNIITRAFLSQVSAVLPDDEILAILKRAPENERGRGATSSSSSSSPRTSTAPKDFDLYSFNMRACTMQVFSPSFAPLCTPQLVIWSKLLVTIQEEASSSSSFTSPPFGVLQVLVEDAPLPTPSSPSSVPSSNNRILKLISSDLLSLQDFNAAIIRTVTAISCRAKPSRDSSETERVDDASIASVGDDASIASEGGNISIVASGGGSESVQYFDPPPRSTPPPERQVALPKVPRGVIPLDPVAADGWDFFALICSLHINKLRYIALFQTDIVNSPFYKYLNVVSFETSVDHSTDALFCDSSTSRAPLAGKAAASLPSGGRSILLQTVPATHASSSAAITTYLHGCATAALPIFSKLVSKIASAVSITVDGPLVGVGPVKTISAALSKSQRLYGGDVRRVKDFLRATIVLEDLAHVLATLEYLTLRFESIIVRKDVSALEAGGQAYAGGYRDATVTIKVLGLLCEISLAIKSMWRVTAGDGYRHCKHCRELSIDALESPSVALKNMTMQERNSMIRYVESVVMRQRQKKGLGEVADLKPGDEVGLSILFAEGLLLLEQQLFAWAEFVFKKLLESRGRNEEYKKFPGAFHLHVRELRRLQELARKGYGGSGVWKESLDAENLAKWNASLTKIVDDCKRRKFDVDGVKKAWDGTKAKTFIFLRGS